MSRGGRLLVVAGVLVAGAASAAHAATELVSISSSPDTTALFGGLEVRDQGVFADDFGGTLVPVAFGDLPEGAAVDAFHDFGDGRRLFSLDGWADLGGLPVTPADLVLFDGSAHSLAFDAGAAGVPAGADVDAVTVDPGGGLLLSFDVAVDLPGGPYRDRDLVLWDGGGFSLGFDGAGAGVPAWADLDAAHRLADGNLWLSFDVGGTVGGVAFADEDVLEHDPATGSWELVYDGSAEHPGRVAADLDALGVGEPVSVLEIPTLSPLSTALLAILLAAAGLGLARRRASSASELRPEEESR
jgi:hypothetical protein